MSFPTTRLRRLRQNEQLRSLVRETRLSPEAFVYPLFVCPGEGVRKEVRSMPGVFNFSIDEAVKEAGEARSLGVPAVVLLDCRERKMRWRLGRGQPIESCSKQRGRSSGRSQSWWLFV